MRLTVSQLKQAVISVINESRRSDREGVELPDTLQQIERYVDRGFYMHFSDIEKLGINPRSLYNTPLGIYAYPITKDVFDRLKDNKLPFASDRQHIHVFVARDPSKVLDIVDLSMERAVEIANEMNTVLGLSIVDDEQKFIRFTNKAYLGLPGSRLWYHSMLLSSLMIKSAKKLMKKSLHWNELWRAVGIDGVVDKGKGIIHENEPEQAVFFSSKAIQQVDVFRGLLFKTKKYLMVDKMRLLETMYFHLLRFDPSKKNKSVQQLFSKFNVISKHREADFLLDCYDAYLSNDDLDGFIDKTKHMDFYDDDIPILCRKFIKGYGRGTTSV
jgi:hypothetical protein